MIGEPPSHFSVAVSPLERYLFPFLGVRPIIANLKPSDFYGSSLRLCPKGTTGLSPGF
jgi:hypothetical protein